MNNKLTRTDLLRLTDTKEINETDLPRNLMDIMLNKERRTKFFKEVLEITTADGQDLFLDYFQDSLAKREKNKQDFTSKNVAKLMAKILAEKAQSGGVTLLEPTAGTGGLLIPQWWNNLVTLHPNPLTYSPHMDYYVAVEMDKEAIPFLIANLAIRGINATVIEGDTINQTAVNVYHLINVEDEFLAFSDVNVLQRDQSVLDMIGFVGYTDEPRDVHSETSTEDVKQWARNVLRNKEAEPFIRRLFKKSSLKTPIQ